MSRSDGDLGLMLIMEAAKLREHYFKGMLDTPLKDFSEFIIVSNQEYFQHDITRDSVWVRVSS